MMSSWQKRVEQMWKPTARMLQQVGLSLLALHKATSFPSALDLQCVLNCEAFLRSWRVSACLTYAYTQGNLLAWWTLMCRHLCQ